MNSSRRCSDRTATRSRCHSSRSGRRTWPTVAFSRLDSSDHATLSAKKVTVVRGWVLAAKEVRPSSCEVAWNIEEPATAAEAAAGTSVLIATDAAAVAGMEEATA
eukprot:6205600-Pleurochrysis_carterae.AAC.1